MTKYSSEHAPPAPVAQVTLRNIDTQETVRNVPMLLDTGSDITLLPRVYCDRIGVEVLPDETLDLIGFDGSISTAEHSQLDLVFLGKLFRGKFLVYGNDEGIIGRDVLNEFVLRFHGPRLEWSEFGDGNSV